MQCHRQADGDDHLLHGADMAAAQRAPYDFVLDETCDCADDDGENGGGHDRHVQHLRADICHETAERHLLTVRERLQAGGAVDEVHAD